MKVKNDRGKNIDWWFIYKLPIHIGSKETDGGRYLYYDETSSKLSLSEATLDKKNGALYYTLEEIFGKDPDQGYIIYNDENPDGDGNQQKRGHCKGILCFNKKKDTGMMLLHSVPRFPAKGELTLPTNELIYGQTFLCIELSGYKAIEQIADQMLRQQNPEVNIKDSVLPKNITKTEGVYKLYHEISIDESKTTSVVKFKSKKGKEFQLIAKSKVWNDDFWIDLISPTLGVDMEVESWRRGPVTPSKDSESSEEVLDVINIDLSAIGLKNYSWKYTHDHSKWGVSNLKDSKKDQWVCIADINCMISQEKRGGGGICFKEPNLRDSLLKIISKAVEDK
jgi:deoxyribonuclease-2